MSLVYTRAVGKRMKKTKKLSDLQTAQDNSERRSEMETEERE